LDDDKNNKFSFKKVGITVDEKSEKAMEVIPDNQINASSKILAKGVFDLAN
jgi:membrane fusion protein, heavy metal efflux system